MTDKIIHIRECDLQAVFSILTLGNDDQTDRAMNLAREMSKARRK